MTISQLVGKIGQSRAGCFCDNSQFVPAKLGNCVLDEHTRIFAHRKDFVKRNLSVASIPPSGAGWLNHKMNKYQYRKQWLRNLLKKENSVAALAAKLETDPNYISSLLGPSSKKNVGDDIVRRAERVYRLSAGVMDMPSEGAQKVAEAADGMSVDQIKQVLEFMRFVKSTKN